MTTQDLPKAFLEIGQSPDETVVGRRVELESPLVVGRSPECQLVIQDRAMSRRHAELRMVDGRWAVVDLGSANGVWVGSQRVAEHHLRNGDSFRLGGTVFVFRLQEGDALDPTVRLDLRSPTASQAGPPPQPAGGPFPQSPQAPPKPSEAPQAAAFQPAVEFSDRFEEALTQWGRTRQVSGNTPWVIGDPNTAWLVKEGQVVLFTVPLDEQGEPQGARTHFCTMGPGSLIFGMDFRRYGLGAGILAVGKVGTQVVEVAIGQLKVFAKQERYQRELARLVDAWVQTVATSFASTLGGGPSPTVVASPGAHVEVPNGGCLRGGREVGWLEVTSGEFLFVGWEPLQPPGHRSGDLLEQLSRLRAVFPLPPQVWMVAANPADQATTARVHEAVEVIATPAFWAGLAAFHEVVCRCEFINKRLALVDELHRLRVKAEHAQAAGEEAEKEIAGVMAQGREEAAKVFGPSRDPVFDAVRRVGEALGITVRDHPEVDKKAPLALRLEAIAKASRFRTRPVALRDDWYRRDQGPILGAWEEGGGAVALLPRSAKEYQFVDPATGEQGLVTEAVAQRLSAFGWVFYRPFPDGPLSAKDLIRFGLRGLKSDLWWVVAMGVGLGLLGTVPPYFTGRLFDTAIPQADRALLWQFVVGLLVAAFVSSAFKVCQSIAVLRVQGKMDYSIQAALWDRLLNLPSNALRQFTAGDLADRAQGVDKIRSLVAGAGINSVLGFFSSIFYVFLMARYSLPLAAAGLAISLLYVAFTTTANYLRLRLERQEIGLRGAITGMVLQFITGVPKIRVAGAENHAFKTWAKSYAQQRRLLFRIGQIKNAIQVLSSGFPVLSSLGIFYVLWKLQEAALAKGQPPPITTGDFIAFNAAFSAFVAALQGLGDASLDMLRIIPIYERLKPIVTTPPELDEARAYPGRLKGEIQVSHVSFRYSEDGPWILNDLSVHIKPGEFIAFVGASGCGKSTLMRILLGFETPTRGAVYFDGQDLATLDLREVRQQIGVVLQNSTLLPTDIYRNIVGSSGLPVQAAWEAAALAGLAEDIAQLPMGMHTYISEGGGGFSGGQRQKVLIARALVRKPRILIFDEATSALDNRSQAVVMESIEKLQATRIVIAHRLSTIINADRICYLEGGRIVEEGTFQELMAKGGKFALLAQRQLA
ncbi:MAG: NHLP bacteriocin export ABC transporter permease/ATPase subunit [Thermoanaerobaculum sp.]|nr:NHLP bacteriocin export ABC transporter permease/ATPase subunit [Thermoanaerobaculum sp.]MDW7967967.1 NHLP bacteriocin export ABC transporter permease/ATPase subunit [Thermoanaerobaculum sp.]